MSIQSLVTSVTFTTVLVVLIVAHWVADHWVQTGSQAQLKGKTGPESGKGRLAVSLHVLTYVLTQTTLIAAVAWILHLPVDPKHVALGLSVNAFTHWWADRRWTLQLLAKILGKSDFYQLAPPLGGAYLLDQAWHYFWLLPTALIIAS